MAYSLRHSRKKAIKIKASLILVGFVGVLLFLLGAYIKYQKYILSFNESPPEVITTNKRAAVPANIIISSANIDLSVEESDIVDGVWEISETGASFLSSSARPGEMGNIVIYGHNKKKLFGNLINKNLIGQIIQIRSEDGTFYEYKISNVKTVSPTNIEDVLPTDGETLTLYTCTGILDSKRLIIKAEPINSN